MEENSASPRKMFQGDWTCSNCGHKITELPFEPDPSRASNLLCRDCHKESRGTRRSGPRNGGGGSGRVFQGDWTCSGCGQKITELPFEPDPSRLSELLCRNCHRDKIGMMRR